MNPKRPPNVTDEQVSLRLFKDALTKYSTEKPWSFLSDEEKTVAELADAMVEDAYAKVREHAPEDLGGNEAPAYAQILTTLRKEGKERQEGLPSRRVLVHMLANLDYYFFKLAEGHARVYDMPDLTDEGRAAEHGLRHDLLLKLYEELEPAFDVSLHWPPNGYEVSEDGKLIKVEAEFRGMAAVGYDCGYDMQIFYEGHADDEEYVRGFVEGCLQRIGEDEPEEENFLRNLWTGDEENDKKAVLDSLKYECEVREGRFDDRPEFPV
jgi:hypothetical protein